MLSTRDQSLFIGLMSGTSLDGVDGVLVDLAPNRVDTLASAYVPFSSELRAEFMALQIPASNEIHHAAVAGLALADCYADCIAQLLSFANVRPTAVRAVGAHGQTVRHRPELGYTIQINQPARLAELSGIDVVADFRSRDIAAGGHGAPLVPAFHQALFGATGQTRVIVNIGGMSNISILPADPDAGIAGFDTGPGNVLLDSWIGRQRGMPFDRDGAWAAGGKVHHGLLDSLRQDPYFSLKPPKSTGRELFDVAWLERTLAAVPALAPDDVQATLGMLTATTVADGIAQYARDAEAVYVCGGGAANLHLLHQIQASLAERNMQVHVHTTDALGVAPNHVEALAFAWLAQRFCLGLPGNVPAVTGARGVRRLGALYPA